VGRLLAELLRVGAARRAELAGESEVSGSQNFFQIAS